MFRFPRSANLSIRFHLLVLTCGIGSLLSSCSRFSSTDASTTQNYVSPIVVGMQLSKNSYGTGEAVIAYTWIYNTSSKTFDVQKVNAGSMEFSLVRRGAPGVTRVRPVVSRKEPMGENQKIEPGQSMPQPNTRAFVFTTITRDAGDFLLQGTYHPSLKTGESELSAVAGKPLSFKVGTERVFNRDYDGILLKSDAIALAKQYFGRPTSAADAILNEVNEGFLVWEIVLTVDSRMRRPGETGKSLLLVNPYLGLVIDPHKKDIAKKQKAILAIPSPDAVPEVPPVKTNPPPIQ